MGSKPSRMQIFRRFSQMLGVVVGLIGFFGITMTHIIFPAIHCYACPWSSWICPVGIAQHFGASGTIPFFFLGTLFIYGIAVGRAWCGWVCPFGTFNDLLSGLGRRNARFTKPNYTRRWGVIFFILFLIAWFVADLNFKGGGDLAAKFFSFEERWPLFLAVMIGAVGSIVLFANNRQSLLKYMVLALTIFLAWIMTDTMFCKICPVATLEASVPQAFRLGFPLAGPFYLHIYTLIVTILGVILIARFWCRYICPMGAMLGVFNRVSFLQLRHSSMNCGNCRAQCITSCPMGIRDIPKKDFVTSSDCIRCGECATACPHDCISFKSSRDVKLEEK